MMGWLLLLLVGGGLLLWVVMLLDWAFEGPDLPPLPEPKSWYTTHPTVTG